MNKTIWCLLVICMLMCSGCAGKNEAQPSLEELAMVGVIAFDYMDESTMHITVIAPQPSPDAKEHTQSYSVDASMVEEGLVQVSAKSDRMINLSQLRVALFSEEFAKKGKLLEVVEYFYREAEVRETVRIGIVKGNAGEVLEGDYPDKPNTNVYINNLMEPTLFTTFSPFTDLHIFMADAKDPVLSPTVPYLEIKDELPEITKIALFNGNHMLDTLNQEDGKIIQALSGIKKIAPSVINLSEEEEIVLKFINSKVKLKSNSNFDSPKISIKLSFESALGEYRGPNKLATDDHLKKLQKDVEKKMEESIYELLGKLKKFKVDPIGLFEPLRMKYHGKWSEDMTSQLLEKAEFDVTVDIEIVNIGSLK